MPQMTVSDLIVHLSEIEDKSKLIKSYALSDIRRWNYHYDDIDIVEYIDYVC